MFSSVLYSEIQGMRVERFKRDLRGNFFAQMVLHTRNELPDEMVEMDTIMIFKGYLEGIWVEMFWKDMVQVQTSETNLVGTWYDSLPSNSNFAVINCVRVHCPLKQPLYM